MSGDEKEHKSCDDILKVYRQTDENNMQKGKSSN